jgi:hypothetical protein
MKMLRILPLLAACLSWPGAARAQPPVPVHVEVLQPPMRAQAKGAAYLVYEVHVTNLLDRRIALDSVEVLGADGRSLRAYGGTALEKNLRRAGPAPDSAAANVLDTGQRGIVFVWAPAGSGDPPAALAHRVVVSAVASGARVAISTPPVPVDGRAPIVLGPPLRGGGWIAANGPDPDSTPVHNRMLVGVEGKIMLPQRFATDWTRLGADGRLWRGDAARNEHWTAWDEELLAVADGEVVEAVDTLPDNPPGEYGRGAANRLVIRVADDRFAVYVHLRRGSLRVRVGETVRRGQVVALVGNSGNSTSAHLHFQVLDTPSSIAGEGVPFVFDRYEVQGVIGHTIDEYEAGAVWRPGPGAPAERRRELPVGGEVIRF